MTTEILGEYAMFVPHRNDSEKHKRRLQRLAFYHRVDDVIEKHEKSGAYEQTEHQTSKVLEVLFKE